MSPRHLVKEVEQDTNQMDLFHQMSDVLVPILGLLVAQHMTL
jgi:hypothetical protein